MKKKKIRGLVSLAGLLASVMLFGMTAFAQSQGQVKVGSAKIRSDANASSTVLASVASGDSLTIQEQVSASDGYTWYKVFVNANTLGYIRSDLVTITDGTTPPTGTISTDTASTDTASTDSQSTDTSTATAAADQTTQSSQTDTSTTQTTDTAATSTVTQVEPTLTTDVEKVNPVSATVKGGESVRVRSQASTKSDVVTKVSNGFVLTVVGRTTGTDGMEWYQVDFIENGNETEGFIRSDFATLSEELTPLSIGESDDVETDETVSDSDAEETVSGSDEWTTQFDEEWYLVDNAKSERYKINDIFNAVENNKLMYENEHSTAQTQKMIIIVLVILIVILIGVVAILSIKIKDIKDDAYFEAIEKDMNDKRNRERAVGMANGQASSRSRGQAPKSQMTRNQASQGQIARGQASQGQMTRGQAPQGQMTRGQAPQGQMARSQAPQGQMARSQAPQGQMARSQAPQGQMTRGQAPQGQMAKSQAPQGQMTKSQTTANRQETADREVNLGTGSVGGIQTSGNGEKVNPAENRKQMDTAGNKTSNNSNKNSQGWKSKNFMSDDDDDFEFDFLNNWDDIK